MKQIVILIIVLGLNACTVTIDLSFSKDEKKQEVTEQDRQELNKLIEDIEGE
jgi:hypothetical protein